MHVLVYNMPTATHIYTSWVEEIIATVSGFHPGLKFSGGNFSALGGHMGCAKYAPPPPPPQQHFYTLSALRGHASGDF